MRLSYLTNLTDDERTEVSAHLSTDHPSSSYGIPVIILETDNEPIDLFSWVALDYRILEASQEERAGLQRLFAPLGIMFQSQEADDEPDEK